MSSAVRYQVMPPLSSEEYQDLYESIKAEGVLEPIHVDEEGVVIDGHHRSRIASELGVPCPVITHDDLSQGEKIALAFTLNLKRRHLSREQKEGLVIEYKRLRPLAPASEVAKATGVSDKTVKRIERDNDIPSPTEFIRNYADEHPEKSNREISRDLGVHRNTVTDSLVQNSEIPKNVPLEKPLPSPGISPAEVAELNNPQLDRVDPELEARVKAMSSAPGTGKHISATSAAERNETRYSAQITAREIISKQKELIALLANVGGFNGMDNYLQIMQENHDTIREMSQTGGIDAELNNLIGGK